MQPDEKRNTKRQTGISRARVLLKKHVGWLPGYPVSMHGNLVRWQSIPWDGSGFEQSWTLSGRELRQAQMTITKLRHHFRIALPKIVDDVDSWLSRMDFILDSLKSTIHDGQTFDPDQIFSTPELPSRWIQRLKNSRQRHPRLEPLFNAIFYLELSKRRQADITLIQWISQNADTLESLGSLSIREDVLSLQLRFCALRESCSDRLFKTLARAYADPLIRDCPTQDGFTRIQWLQQAISDRITGSEIKAEPEPIAQTVFQQIDPLLKKISLEKPKRKGALLALLDLLLCEESLDQINGLKSRINECDRRLTRFYRQLQFGSQELPTNRHERKELLTKLNKDRVSDDGRQEAVKHLAACLHTLPRMSNAEAENWTRFLRLIPDPHQAIRSSLLYRWTDRQLGGRSKHITAFYRALSNLESLLRRRGVAEPVLQSWKEYLESSRDQDRDWIVELCDDHADDHLVIDRSIKLFESAIYDHGAEPGHNLRTTLVEFVSATDDLAQAAAVVAILARNDDTYYSLEELRPALALGTSAKEIATIATAINGTDDYTMETAADALVSLATDTHLRSAIVSRILADDQKTLQRMASIHQLLIALDGQSSPQERKDGEPKDWMSIYPDELHSELVGIAQQTPRAKSIAAEILGKDFPDPQRTRNEIAAISAKLELLGDEDDSRKRSHLKQRAANLQDRLRQRATASPARMATLAKKLRARIEYESIEQYIRSCRDSVAAIISDRYQMEHVPDELLDPPLDAVLADILRLSPPMRELGLRLIFETLNRCTRRFDSEPANEEFHRTMQRQSVNMDAWIGDAFETTAKSAAGVPYRLSFTRDVIDFLLMGFHFGTCLSPGDCNFFSTVANAADINKRVVYGRTESGKIIGRCLFALNDDGHILTYHRYAHDAEDNFGEAVDHFATELAMAMNSRLTNQGTVTNLVAKDWYDDGAIRVSESETNDELVRRLMSNADPNSVLFELKKIISCDQICSRIDELVAMDEIKSRPETLRGLLSSLAQEDALTRSQRLIVARVAYSCTATEVAMHSITRVPPGKIIAVVKQSRCDYCSAFHGIGAYREVFAMITEFNPSIAIRVMRTSRETRCRDDLSDKNPIRRKALARAHRELGRTQLADQLSQSQI